MDYYTTLGVPRTASPEEIKRAYRQKAKQYHPDRPDGDAEMFKRVNEAYEILSNSDKRSAYDNPEPNYNFRSQDFHHSQFGGHPFDDFFSQFGQRQPRPKNRDINITANLELIDVITGKSLIVEYRLQSGKLETVTIDIPPGAKNGDRIKYQDLGDDGHHKFQRGDLIVKILVKPHPQWTRNNDNLTKIEKINVFDILLGCAIIVKTLDNKKVRINVPKGTKSGTVLSVPGYGLPNLNTGTKGSLLVRIDVDIPNINDDNILMQLDHIKNKLKTKD